MFLFYGRNLMFNHRIVTDLLWYFISPTEKKSAYVIHAIDFLPPLP